MALNASKVKSSSAPKVQQEVLEAGSYPCRVAQILSLGLQPQRPYQGQEKPPAQEIMITYEFTDEFCVDEDGVEQEDKPRWLSETLPFRSLDSDLAKSTKRYMALDPDVEHGGDFTKLIGKACNVTIVNKAGTGKSAGKTFANIQSISSMRAKDEGRTPELVNEGKFFDIDEPDLEVFGSLPDWLQDKIKGNLEYQGSALQKALEGGSEEVPEASEDKDSGEEEEWV